MMNNYIYLVVLFPLIGFVINGLLGSKIKNEKIIGFIASGSIGLSFLFTVFIFFETLSLPQEMRSKTVEVFNWISAGAINIKAAYLVDQLSLIMTLVVTGVGFFIHLYSIGYMHGDKGFWRFFAYLNLFIFAMLNLVLADNFLLLFLGWEGVGLCSYLLIGFWYEKDFDKGTTGDAAKKAFIVNRIGDFGFLIGMFLIFVTFQSLNFETVFSKAEGFEVGNKTIMFITLMLFIGCTGKSAQIPLYIWLPDAMAGPTPVSALIHAATMVTAGVYLVARCSILFALSPVTMNIIAIIAVATSFFAATIGLVQNDIKKVLAYSTISQLGYMFLGLGVGAFASGIFHLMTHAFFKACLFLGSGSVIHAMHEEQNIQKMGGLKSKMPATYLTFLISALAISGIPPLSGFFSKDEILWKAFSQGSVFLWLIGVITAALTAFYMFRLVGLTFGGKPRWDEGKHPHESPKVMTIPLMVLAFLAVIGGFIGIPASLGGSNSFERWLDPVFEKAQLKLSMTSHVDHSLEYIFMIVSIIIAFIGFIIALNLYTKKFGLVSKFKKSFGSIHTLLFNKYYVDEIYDAAIITPTVKGSRFLLWRFFDLSIIDGIVNGSAKLMEIFGQTFRRMQNGVVQTYAALFITGIIVILAWLIFR
jgi:NADH-quinone oxidoreductase subunit L